MELCKLVPGQRVMKKLDENQTSKMIRETAKDAMDRKRKIENKVSLWVWFINCIKGLDYWCVPKLSFWTSYSQTRFTVLRKPCLVNVNWTSLFDVFVPLVDGSNFVPMVAKMSNCLYPGCFKSSSWSFHFQGIFLLALQDLTARDIPATSVCAPLLFCFMVAISFQNKACLFLIFRCQKIQRIFLIYLATLEGDDGVSNFFRQSPQFAIVQKNTCNIGMEISWFGLDGVFSLLEIQLWL